jgi:hypothetical protein
LLKTETLVFLKDDPLIKLMNLPLMFLIYVRRTFSRREFARANRPCLTKRTT